jgi:hypothetical protein
MTERSAWTHTLCGECWALLNPGREPVRLLHLNPGPEDICCECGRQVRNGVIYVREDPRKFNCLGRHAA